MGTIEELRESEINEIDYRDIMFKAHVDKKDRVRKRRLKNGLKATARRLETNRIILAKIEKLTIDQSTKGVGKRENGESRGDRLQEIHVKTPSEFISKIKRQKGILKMLTAA